MATALLLERSTPHRERELDSALPDWEAPAGGLAARPRVDGVRYTCLGVEEPHLQGQRCAVIDAHTDAEECLVAFACGCQTYVARRLLVA